MNLSKALGILVAAAAALMALASPATATTLYTNGVKQTGSVTFHLTHTSADGTLIFSATGGGFANTCTESTIHGSTTVFTGTPSGPITTFTFGGCTSPLTVHRAGSLSVSLIGAGPNGTVTSTGAEWTTGSPFGTLTCTTNNTDIGTLTGTTSGTSTLDINAVLNCGFFLPSAKWEGLYTITGHSLHLTA